MNSMIVKPTPSILEFVSTVVVPATTEKFVAKDKFVVNTKCNAPVKISYLDDNFKTWFLNGDGKIEDPISEQTLCCYKLRESCADDPIIEEFGGAKAETTLFEMFSCMMKRQKNGVCVIVFYIKDQNGVLRGVDAFWFYDAWRVFAFPFGRPIGWDSGSFVFSRNSVLLNSVPQSSTLEPSATAQA